MPKYFDQDCSISIRKFIKTSILKGFDQKNHFFEGRSWFRFSNLGLTRGMTLKFYTKVTKGLKLKVRKFWGISPMFVENTGKKLVGEAFLPLILNRVKCVDSIKQETSYRYHAVLFLFFPLTLDTFKSYWLKNLRCALVLNH